jgi:peptide/nickel transport system ATP-binding protein
MSNVLDIKGLKVDFVIKGKKISSPIRGIDLSINAGETHGIVGETGCGKSLTALAIMGMLPANAVRTGSISLGATGELTSSNIRQIRGNSISMIFQNPHSAFNPVFTIEQQLLYVAKAKGFSSEESHALFPERLKQVGLVEIQRILKSYPHELSGGMLQRCMIAMALLSRPKLLIADEPTTALDATIGGQVLALLKRLQREQGFAMLFISHDVTAVSRVSERIAVLYAGKIVEDGATADVLGDPQHPYTKGLLGAIPSRNKARGTLAAIPGTVPSNTLGLIGCAFKSRCQLAVPHCDEEPILSSHGHTSVACWEVSK